MSSRTIIAQQCREQKSVYDQVEHFLKWAGRSLGEETISGQVIIQTNNNTKTIINELFSEDNTNNV